MRVMATDNLASFSSNAEIDHRLSLSIRVVPDFITAHDSNLQLSLTSVFPIHPKCAFRNSFLRSDCADAPQYDFRRRGLRVVIEFV